MILPLDLSPYRKAVLTAVGGLITTAISFLVGDGADAATLGTAIMTVLTTLGVYKVANEPAPKTESPLTPSAHIVEYVAPRKRPTSKAVKRTSKKGE